MLAQNFKTADELKISAKQKDALAKVLVLLETGRLAHAKIDNDRACEYRETNEFTGHFNMGRWRAVEDCGTVCCIAGTAEIVGGVTFPTENYNGNYALRELFWVGSGQFGDISKITPDQAAAALRSYLSTGQARWDLALSSKERASD